MAMNKAEGIARAISECMEVKPTNMLVVGCGTGEEVVTLKRYFGCKATGIDIKVAFSESALAEVDLRYGDATAMDFSDGAFDFVYSYHALEHIPEYRKALGEIRRVLSSDGVWCIGTPNRSRLIGYLGSADATLKDKLLWNLDDWKMRITGRFKNEYGAHAGFTTGELEGELVGVFGDAVDITTPYYRHIYPSHARLVERLSGIGIGRFLFPSVYFTGRLAR